MVHGNDEKGAGLVYMLKIVIFVENCPLRPKTKLAFSLFCLKPALIKLLQHNLTWPCRGNFVTAHPTPTKYFGLIVTAQPSLSLSFVKALQPNILV